jgi:prepilin-type N-terminal cleavage/methylation domain-containing protein
MSNIKNRKEGGFTIIEVLIVLMIAGLIMLIVFLAVPALQRSSRNTQRKNDASRIATAANEFVSNNNGTMPTSTDLSTITDSAGKLGQYDASDVKLAAGTQSALSGTSGLSTIRIVTGAKCGTSGATAAGQSRQFAVQYMVETSGGQQATCQDS